MCLTIRNGTRKEKPYIATEAITCYKVVRGKKYITSEYKHFRYELGKLYKVEMGKIYDRVERGLHSYTIKGLKSSSHKILYDSKRAVRCKIPKGASYYIGRYGDLVSNKIKLVKMLSTEEFRKLVE